MNYEKAVTLAQVLSPEYCTHALHHPLRFDTGVNAPLSKFQPDVIIYQPAPSCPATILCKAKLSASSENDREGDPSTRCFLTGGQGCPEGLKEIDLPMEKVTSLFK